MDCGRAELSTVTMQTLRPYQSEALDAMSNAEARGVRCQMIVMATGLGKTTVFSNLISRRNHLGRTLVIAHRQELISQAARRIIQTDPRLQVGIVLGAQKQINARVVVGSVQTLSRSRTLDRIKQDFATIICDEAHHSAADSYGRIFEYVAPSNPLLVGFTATPRRSDGKSLDEWFSEIVYEMNIVDGISQGWLCDVEGVLVHLKGADFQQLHIKRGDYDTSELEQMLHAANWYEHIVLAWEKHASDRQTVIFVPPKKAMALQLEQFLCERGHRAKAIIAETQNRNAIYQAFERREIQILISVDVLTEGWDAPITSCVVMARPTKSQSVYLQAVGRGLRTAPGKQNCLVLDLVGVTQRHDLCTIASLAGVEKLNEGESLSKAKERGEIEQKEKEQKDAEEKEKIAAEHEAKKVELLRRQRQAEARERYRSQQWQQGIDNRHTFVLHDRIVSIRPTAGELYFVTDGREFRHFSDAVEGCKLAAYDLIQKVRLKDPAASWRSKPASDKQLSTLTKYRVYFQPNITMGEASDLLDALFSSKARTKAA